jgi:hypothetical protein
MAPRRTPALFLSIALVLALSAPTLAQSSFSEESFAAFRRELYSHHLVITAEWLSPENQTLQRSSGTLGIIAKVEDEKGATLYGVTNFHVAAPDFKNIPAGTVFLAGLLIVDKDVIARRYVFPAKLVAIDPKWDRMLLLVNIPRNPKDLGEEFLKRLEKDEFPTTYSYQSLIAEITPARFRESALPPPRGTPLWLVGFAGGRVPRIVELAMNFEDPPSRYQMQFREFQLPRIWVMDIVSSPIGGMSGGFVYNSRGEVVALYHGHFAVQSVPVLASTTPGPELKAWIIQELARVGVRM